jgi:hypothetical protein
MKLGKLLLLVCLFACLITPVSSQPKKEGHRGEPDSLSALVTGTVTSVPAADVVRPEQPQAPPVSFTGVLSITNFVAQNGVLMAVGTLSGALADATGNVIRTIQDQPVAFQITSLDPSCPILFFRLGPLDLNVLGLVVHLNAIELNITAQTGRGNLLGNLLCALVSLLDGGFTASLLASIAALLNQILAAL